MRRSERLREKERKKKEDSGERVCEIAFLSSSHVSFFVVLFFFFIACLFDQRCTVFNSLLTI